jgi:hypothetical protein
MSTTKVGSAMQDLSDNYAFTGTVSGVVGTIVQVVNVQTGAVATGTTTMSMDDTIAQNTEGNEYMTLAITPTNSSNKLLIQVVWIGSFSTASEIYTAALFQDSTASAIAVASHTQSSSTVLSHLSFNHYMAAGTVSATTFKVRVGCSSAQTTTFNGVVGGRKHGGVMASSITITEIAV